MLLVQPTPHTVLHGLVRDHNAAVSFYGLAACIVLALMLHTDRIRIVSLPTLWFAAIFTGLTLSKSRTAYTAFLVTGCFMLFSARKQAKRILKLVALIVVPLSTLLLTQPEVS